MQGVTEAIVFLLRTTSLTLTDLRDMTREQFLEVYEEASYQDQMRAYQEAHNTASIMATVINCTPRKDNRTYKPSDFVGHAPTRGRQEQKDDIGAMLQRARARGLKTPRVILQQLEEES